MGEGVSGKRDGEKGNEPSTTAGTTVLPGCSMVGGKERVVFQGIQGQVYDYNV